MNWVEIGRFLIIAGISIAIVGIFFLLTDKFQIGRLPGDIHINRGHIRFYVPITTCILLSILITLILNFFSRK